MKMDLTGSEVVVVGMARSGVAACELLRAKGARVRAVDEKPASPEILPQVEASFENAQLIVISPGVPADLVPLEAQRQKGVRIIGDLELASWFLEGPIIGITGANGKTTTTALTGHVLSVAGVPVQVGGNIGTPPASMVGTSRADQWNVLELSSFQLETTETFHAKIGAALNVTPDHLDRHRTMERYAEAKGRLFRNQTSRDFAVLNANDPICSAYAKSTPAQAVWFSSTREVAPGAFLRRGEIIVNQQTLMRAAEIPLRGMHNVENAMAAAAMASLAGVSHSAIREAVMSFPGIEHRIEFVRELHGIAWYNDSKATNVDATLKALEAFDGGLWVILGGKDKNSDYSQLIPLLQKKARGALLIGAAAPKIAAQLKGQISLHDSGTLAAAIAEARCLAHPGDTVLLAPACASFDQFENFEHRGREFKRLVRELQ